GHSGREGRNEGRDEAPEVSRARGAEGEVPQRSAAQARVRGADARSAKGIPVSLRRREAVRDQDRADREGNACDIRRTRVSGAAIDLIPGDQKVDWYARGVGGAAAREIKGIPAGRPKTQESNIRPAGMKHMLRNLSAENDVGGMPCRLMFGDAIAKPGQVDPGKHRFAFPKQDRRECEMQFVNQSGAKILAHR